MRAGHNQYAPMTGIPALRQAIAAKTERVYGHRPDADAEVTVTSGATEAIFDAIHAVVRPGEEVIVLDPCYDCYEPAIDLAGARAVHVPLDPRTFAPDWQRVRDAITPQTRMLMINSPHNPSGAMLTAGDMDTVADMLRDTGIVLLSDEVYEHIVFDGAPPRVGAALSGAARARASWSPASARPTTAPAGRSATASRRRR